MHKYHLNNKEVTMSEWRELYKKNPEATVILRTTSLSSVFIPPKTEQVISPERAQAIRESYKKI